LRGRKQWTERPRSLFPAGKVVSGRAGMKAGDRLPGERELALKLGFLDIRHGSGAYVRQADISVLSDFFTFSLGAQIVGAWLAKDLVTAYLEAEFSTDDDFRRRVHKLAKMDGER
jgi:hypothetical protein